MFLIDIYTVSYRILKQEMFQKHICPPWCKIQVYLLCRSKTCPKQVSKGLKFIKWTTHWAQKSGLTLTFEHVTWKSIGCIYSLRATPCTKFGIDQVKGSKDVERTTLGLQIDRQLQNYMPPFSRGHKNIPYLNHCLMSNSIVYTVFYIQHDLFSA